MSREDAEERFERSRGDANNLFQKKRKKHTFGIVNAIRAFFYPYWDDKKLMRMVNKAKDDKAELDKYDE
jgi:hypothetical protein